MTAYTCACSTDWEGKPATVPCDREEGCMRHGQALRLSAEGPADLGLHTAAGTRRADRTWTLLTLALGAITLVAALVHQLL